MQNQKLLKQILTHLAALVVGVGIGYFIWNANKTQPVSEASPKSTTVVVDTTAVAPQSEMDTTTATTPTPVLVNEEITKVPVNTQAICGGNQVDLKNHLSAVAASIEKKAILYNTEDLSDCSGMFLRVVKAMEGLCPDYVYPNPQDHRDTRLLGKWFYENNNLQMVDDALKYSHLIKPEAVLFFGHNDKVYTNLTVEQLVAPDGIEHVGVVTEVKKNADGIVTNYTMFHGRTHGKIAARTSYHNRKDKTKGEEYYPPYGNGRQYLIAIGFVTTPKKEL